MPVIVAADFPPAIGGIQRYMERVAEGFATLGHSVTVVAPAFPDAHDDRRTYAVERYASTGRPATLWAMDRAIARAQRRVGDGVVIASSWFPAGLVAVRRRIGSRGKLAVMAFGSEIVRQDTRPRRLAMRSVFSRADAVISISRFTSEELRVAGVTALPVMAGCGVDPGAFRPNPTRNPTILSVGRLVRRKGFDRVVNALPYLRGRFGDVRYEIIGDGPDAAYLAELARRLGVESAVVFHGAADDDVVRAAYERAWCFALPVRREGHDVEGFGLVYLEAATARLPSLGGRGSGADDAIVDGTTGLLVDGRSDAEVAKALERLLCDGRLRTALGDAAYERAMREFSWDRVTAAIADSVGLSR
jgi:phosphatidylinositol alpha-1,6-mannosyltransferase